MLKIAITGNIASGKSQVEKLIAKKYPVFDTDKIAHEILDNLKDFEGYDVFTEGKIDRKKLGKLVFSNPNIKKKLEDLIHPQVKQRLDKIFDENKNEDYVFVSVPLLFETGFNDMFDKIILVTTDEETRLERLIVRDNLSIEEANKRINAQMSEKTKINKSDFVIDNNSSFSELEAKVNVILSQI